MASGIYTAFKSALLTKEVDLVGDSVKCMLLTSVHSFTATHAKISDINTNEIAATGNYATGGAVVSELTVIADTTCKWDAADRAWTSATFNASHAVLYDATAASSCLICSFDFGGIKTVSAGTFTIAWNAAGIMTLST